MATVFDAVKYLRVSILYDTGGTGVDWASVVEDDNGTSELLWTNEELCSFIDEAQMQAINNLGGIKDYSSTYNISVVASQSEYSISPKILRITNAWLTSNGRELDHKDLSDIVAISNWSTEPGTPKNFVTNYKTHKLYLYPMPEDSDTLNLHIYRLPENTVSWDNYNASLEIDEQNWRKMLWYAAFLAYTKQDPDANDEKKALKFKALFEEQFDSVSAYSRNRKLTSSRRGARYGGLGIISGNIGHTNDYGKQR